MASTLRSPPVIAALGRLHAKADIEDDAAKRRVSSREGELGVRLAPPRRYELYGDAPLAITAEVGQLYYLLAATCSPEPDRRVRCLAWGVNDLPGCRYPRPRRRIADHHRDPSRQGGDGTPQPRRGPALKTMSRSVSAMRWRPCVTSPTASTCWCSTGATISTSRSSN